MTAGEERARKQQILRAGRWCFFNLGYAQTSLKDIAARAGIARPLIYRAFANKAAIFVAVMQDGFDERCRAAEEVAVSNASRGERLWRLCELLLLEPWADMANAPKAIEFFEVCSELAPKVEERQRRRVVKCAQLVLGTRELTDVFLLALEGLESDLPSTTVLRRRVELLVERFVAP
jgi:AcrR family transcriptional regulator